MGRIVRSCMQSILKLVNSLIGMVGMAMILYAVWMIRVWQRNVGHFPFAGGSHYPAPWFIYTFLGVGITLCVITCTGHIAAETANGCCLYLYILFVFLLLLLEAGVTADVFLNRNWEEDFPVDRSGNLDRFKDFVRSNFEICKWIGLSIVSVQVLTNEVVFIFLWLGLSLLLAMILKALGPHQYYDSDDDYAYSLAMFLKALGPHQYYDSDSLEFRYLEHSLAVVGDSNHEAHSPTFWQPPDLGTLKLNTDAAVGQHSSTIAVIARDGKGYVCNAWARMVDTVDPDIAEALAIKWAVQLASEETFTRIIVESDSNRCIESIIGSPEDTCWKIEAICSDVNILALDFISCCFSWVKRDANSAAHELAKFAAHLGTPLSCNASSLPPNVFKAWQRDMLCFSFQ